MQRISVNLTNDCDGNQLNYNNDLPAIGNKNFALQKPFETCFVTVIGNAKLRPSFIICWVGQGNRPLCGPRHPILQSDIFFYVKLFATIILSWNLLKCILWYLLELSEPFIKNEKSALPVLIQKNFEQKVCFCLWKMRSFFFKKGHPIFSIKLRQILPKSFSQLHVKNLRFFHLYFLKNDDWPKAYAGPRLPTLPTSCCIASSSFSHILQFSSSSLSHCSCPFSPFAHSNFTIIFWSFPFMSRRR